MIPFIVALTFSILLTLVFAIPGTILCIRWFEMVESADSNIGDMKIPTFFATEPDEFESGDIVARSICMFVVGSVFGGIHCVGWFFDFPSRAEAMLWRVSSVVLTGIAFLSPIIFTISVVLEDSGFFGVAVGLIFLLVYVVSRLLLVVEAFISLRHLTPGMLALVKWTSFLPHI